MDAKTLNSGPITSTLNCRPIGPGRGKYFVSSQLGGFAIPWMTNFEYYIPQMPDFQFTPYFENKVLP
jgi:hypothetical protein